MRRRTTTTIEGLQSREIDTKRQNRQTNRRTKIRKEDQQKKKRKQTTKNLKTTSE